MGSLAAVSVGGLSANPGITSAGAVGGLYAVFLYTYARIWETFGE